MHPFPGPPAFPPGEGGRASARSDEVAPMRCSWRGSLRLPVPAVSIAGVLRRLLGNSRFFRSFVSCLSCCAWAAAQTCAGAFAAPAPAQGVSPLDPFSLARFLAVARSRRFHRGRTSSSARKLTLFPFLCFLSFLLRRAAARTCAGAIAAPAPAQGVSPLDPFPLARFLGVVFPVSPGGGGRRTAAADTSPRPPAAGAWDPPPTQRTAPPPAPACAPASDRCGCDPPGSPGSP